MSFKERDMEDKQRYHFLKTTTSREGGFIALIADAEKVDVNSLRCAFNAHVSPVMREGILAMTAEQLKQRLPELKKQGMNQSLAAFEKALGALENRDLKTKEAVARVVTSHSM